MSKVYLHVWKCKCTSFMLIYLLLLNHRPKGALLEIFLIRDKHYSYLWTTWAHTNHSKMNFFACRRRCIRTYAAPVRGFNKLHARLTNCALLTCSAPQLPLTIWTWWDCSKKKTKTLGASESPSQKIPSFAMSAGFMLYEDQVFGLEQIRGLVIDGLDFEVQCIVRRPRVRVVHWVTMWRQGEVLMQTVPWCGGRQFIRILRLLKLNILVRFIDIQGMRMAFEDMMHIPKCSA